MNKTKEIAGVSRKEDGERRVSFQHYPGTNLIKLHECWTLGQPGVPSTRDLQWQEQDNGDMNQEASLAIPDADVCTTRARDRQRATIEGADLNQEFTYTLIETTGDMLKANEEVTGGLISAVKGEASAAGNQRHGSHKRDSFQSYTRAISLRMEAGEKDEKGGEFAHVHVRHCTN